ncbi:MULTISPECIES: hypothetical protein [unclassified Iodobacter]|uniref:hypothetical protein n=1 Tax=unclassified Iodobacter TaxID=235634 RepID=UPI0025DF68AF|nr:MULTISPECIES: hypothetical protein [unclassified Iodobacter]MDW5415370.1 hypothetical protein [Iodobacter sp. CM08]
MLIHTQVRKPVVPVRDASALPNFFERNKSASPFAWITLSDEAKRSAPPKKQTVK